MKRLTQKIKQFGMSGGADLVGIASANRWKNAPVELSPQGIWPDAKSVVVIAIHHPDACIELGGEPTAQDPGPGAVGGWMHEKLNDLSFSMAKFIETTGYQAMPIASSRAWRYRPYKRIKNCFIPDLSHIHAGACAGLGEIGYSGLLITPEFGPRIRLTSVLSDALLVPDPMYDGPVLCDRCMECVRACKECADALTKETKGESVVKIEDKVYRYANKNKWRCGWGEHFELDLKRVPIPEIVNEKVILENLAKHGWYRWAMGRCLRFCLPPHLRLEDKNYTRVYRRKRQTAHSSIYPDQRQLTDELMRIAIDKGADLVGVASSSDFRKLKIELKDFLPDGSSVISLGLRIPYSRILEKLAEDMHPDFVPMIAEEKLSLIVLDIAKYLENLGHSVVVLTELSDNLAAVAAGLGKLDKKEEVVTPEYGKRQVFATLITSASLVSTPGEELKGKRSKVNKIRKPVTAEKIKVFSLKKAADLFGVSSVNRFEEIIPQLSEIIKEESSYFTATNKNTIPIGNFVPEVRWENLTVKSPKDYLPDANSIIVLGLHYSDVAVDRAGKPPAEAIGPYAFAQLQTHHELNNTALDVMRFLEDAGYQTVITHDLTNLASKAIYQGTLYSDATANRFAAIAAGLGELGQSGLLLTPEYGVRQRTVSIITDAPLEETPFYDGPPLCKKCNECIRACSVRALNEKKVVKLKIGKKKFGYNWCERLRCDWAKRYALVGEGGPEYSGSRTNIYPPSQITAPSLTEALKQLDPIEKSYICIAERCLILCKARGRI